jgi:hypothetical protein
MLLQVHDELIFEVDEAAVDDVIARVRQVMEGAAQPAVELSVPLVVDAGHGASWAEAHSSGRRQGASKRLEMRVRTRVCNALQRRFGRCAVGQPAPRRTEALISRSEAAPRSWAAAK